MVSTSSAHLTCLCGKVRVPGSILSADEFPIDTEICHCDDCRYVTGALGGTFVGLKHKPDSEVFSNLTTYNTSEKNSRYFCTTCGCHCFINQHDGDIWSACSGMVEQSPDAKERGENFTENIVKVTHHCYIDDTGDGGLAKRLTQIGGRSIPSYNRSESEGKPISEEDILKLKNSKPSTTPQKHDKLKAICHCGKVELNLHRANWPEGSGGSLKAKDPTKYLAGVCACRSCRLATGYSIHAWLFIPPENLHDSQGNVFTSNTDGPHLKQLTNYSSSNGVVRSFCATCGANFLYWRHNRTHLVDVSVGVLRAASGITAEEWLSWDWSGGSYAEEIVDKELLEALVQRFEDKVIVDRLLIVSINCLWRDIFSADFSSSSKTINVDNT